VFPNLAKLPPSSDVLGLPIRPFDLQSLVETIVARARYCTPTLGCYVNAHTANLACADRDYHNILRQCDLLHADGASIVWAARLAGSVIPCRVTAMDYFPLLASRCAEQGLSIFLLGSKSGLIDKVVQRLQTEYPTLRIAGAHHGYFDLDRSDEVIASINAAPPDILLVGMSSPRQEFWLRDHRDEIHVPVRWCVGALFDYLGEAERRAPAFLRQIGCEWLFRLAMDPAGKWRRYLLGNPRFVWNTLRWLSTRNQSPMARPALEHVGGSDA
jgi:N-acetylglucosaminyldiphosphoundecaprenol N-acetyl-beta-D-mannosaminyltransferase